MARLNILGNLTSCCCLLPPSCRQPSTFLSNTKKTLAMAGLEGNSNVKRLDFYGITETNAKPAHKVSDHLMTGVEGKEFLVKNWNDDKEVADVVKAATKEVLRRTMIMVIQE